MHALMGQVFEAAVIGIPHKKWVERPLLIVVAAAGQSPTQDSILRFLKVRNWLSTCCCCSCCAGAVFS